MNIGFIPIDNRPVCYTLAEDICSIDNSLNLLLPPREFLGDLTKYADYQKIFDWIKNLPKLEAVIISLDTLAYGGLISSRRSPDTFDEIKKRIQELKGILKSQNAKIYAFSSIMRISNNNINEEEKEYWSKWGKKIFDYSFQTHKNNGESCIANTIPSEILDDYLETRKRNFEINKIYLEWQKEGFFETLIFSKDDCAEYGFNVQEAKALESLGGFTKTGADEIPLSLLARAIKPPHPSSRQSLDRHLLPHRGEGINTSETSLSGLLRHSEDGSCISHESSCNAEESLCVKIAPIFLEPEFNHLISNYEDISIENSVKGQIELAGCTVSTPENSDILLYVNNFKNHQGEIIMKKATEPFSGNWNTPQKPYMIADVRYANGADNNFVKELFKNKMDKNFYGYSAWNTSANTLGSLICAAKVKFLAQKYNDKASKKLQATRLLDDWAYQANCRQAGKHQPTRHSEVAKPLHLVDQQFSTSHSEHDYRSLSAQTKLGEESLCPAIQELMKPFERQIFEFLGENYEPEYSFPWNRFFEIEVKL